ncbi:glucose dehydrogenase [FAD, quinone]-like isoform X2 [Athalia rosae]|uniref:glucose dehydrogenase [FAD, quinone]-like isoform X2 n=1 Tax=Athalia rosae TaxID=37344 RepID=UPI00203482A7|nr:glucose dehydrogenase [FAD, quinone]-like isoform X2 [Athalia rosae]
MTVAGAYSAARIALSYGPEFSFLVFLRFLIVLLRQDIIDRENRVEVVSTKDMFNTYDFIIIGGGSAGSVVANRLSENANWTVLLLEAGGDETVLSDVPLVFPTLQLTAMDWQFKTEPSSMYCQGMNNNQCNWPRGKVLGGSSVLNAMLYVRGNRRDYDNWRDMGNPGWGYDSVLPYFKKSENTSIPELLDSPYHGTDGYLSVEKFRYNIPIAQFFLDAGHDLGYDVVDVNGATQSGFTFPQGTLRDGLRCSSAKAFLRPASRRKNLHVSTHSNVDKILVHETTMAAYGVQFRRGIRKYSVYARNEVILSAGAIQSPQLLMISGIGPKEHLEEIGIPVIHDSPGVGQNLQDHVAIGGLTYLIDPPPACPDPNGFAFVLPKLLTISTVKQFSNERRGPLYDVPECEAMAFVNTKFVDPALDYPDMEYTLDLTGGTVRNVFFTGGKNRTYGLRPSVLRPKSRGYVKLRDDNPETHPIIVYNYFKHPQDLRVMIEGVKLTYNYSKTRTLQRLKARLDPLPADECAHFPFFSDEYLGCYARYYTNSAYHLCGTCKMGPANDTMAVVDPRLKVYGIRRLRVIDASIIPVIPSGNINAPTIMIAEKAADMIKEDHRKSENTCEQYL